MRTIVLLSLIERQTKRRASTRKLILAFLEFHNAEQCILRPTCHDELHTAVGAVPAFCTTCVGLFGVVGWGADFRFFVP